MTTTEYLLGFDVGGTKCAAVLGRRDGDNLEIVDRAAFATADFPEPDKCIRRFSEAMRELLDRRGVAAYSGVGISCGGPLDAERGVVLSPPNLPGWDEVPVVEVLAREFGCPARLCNDADACAVAEWRFGAGRGCRNMIFLTFGTGLGAGLILNGALYQGANGMAGECGHIRLAPDGPTGYGKRGSFEGFCSGGGLRQLAEAAFPGKKLDAKQLAQAADSGNETARGVWRECGRRLGEGLAVLIDLLNPERIVLGSIFARAGHLLVPTMREVLAREALPRSLSVCRVLPAELGDAIGDYACLAVAPNSTAGR
jgi:glucokinase